MAYKQFIIFQTNVWLQIFDKINDIIPSLTFGNTKKLDKKHSDLKIYYQMFSAFHTLFLKQEEARIESVTNTYSFNCALKNKRC